MANRYSQYLTTCTNCNGSTSKKYAREHGGKCARCINPLPNVPTRNERILESGYMAYAIEEGHYDQGE